MSESEVAGCLFGGAGWWSDSTGRGCLLPRLTARTLGMEAASTAWCQPCAFSLTPRMWLALQTRHSAGPVWGLGAMPKTLTALQTANSQGACCQGI